MTALWLCNMSRPEAIAHRFDQTGFSVCNMMTGPNPDYRLDTRGATDTHRRGLQRLRADLTRWRVDDDRQRCKVCAKVKP